MPAGVVDAGPEATSEPAVADFHCLRRGRAVRPDDAPCPTAPPPCTRRTLSSAQVGPAVNPRDVRADSSFRRTGRGRRGTGLASARRRTGQGVGGVHRVGMESAVRRASSEPDPFLSMPSATLRWVIVTIRPSPSGRYRGRPSRPRLAVLAPRANSRDRARDPAALNVAVEAVASAEVAVAVRAMHHCPSPRRPGAATRRREWRSGRLRIGSPHASQVAA